MNEVSLFRLYFLRATYLLLVIGLGFEIWPAIVNHPASWTLWHGVGCSLLAAVSVLALLGIRYPLRMLPVLFFELTWKSIWLIAIALPLWRANQMDANTAGTVKDCLVGIIFLFAIPWPYVVKNYLQNAGDRWK